MSGCSPTMDTLRRKAQQGQVPVRRGRSWSFVGLRRVSGPISRSLLVQVGDALLGLEWGEVRVHQLPPLEIDGPGRRGRTGRDIADGLPPQNMPLAVRRHDRMPSHV